MGDIAPGWTQASAADFAELMAPLSNWGRWGTDDELGTVNLLTAEHARAAASAVSTGECIALGRPLTIHPALDNPQPLLHLMTGSGDAAAPIGGSHASDWVGLAYHGFAVTHLDAHSHQFFNGLMYNGRPAGLVSTRSGAAAGSVVPFARGLVGRGVLLDAPRAMGREWLEPGDGLEPADLDEIAASQDTELRPADLLLVRVGRDARAAIHGAISPMTAGSPGLTGRSLPWLRQHDVAVLGSDVQNDVMRPGVSAHPMPVHAGALAYLGLPLLDNLLLEGLSAACAARGRWDFQLVVAPLALARFTGSPVNPIAIL
ncbi:MAG: putative cyclase [Pseudonocardiales bacterium]|nr:putative cyclase [Pseudonocardiales bacterium]